MTTAENNKYTAVTLSNSWSVEDKAKLLKLLRTHGASRYEVIQQNMPHKSISEIRCLCEKHKKLALNKWCLHESKRPLENQPMTNWLQILKQIKGAHKGEVHDIIPRVLKYIALFEKRTENSHILLSDCYLVLSDISEGLASKQLDEVSNHFFFECLTKLAEALKNGETESYKHYIRNLDNLDNFLAHKNKLEKRGSVLNPLRVPANLLKMTEVDKLIDILE